MVNSAALGAIWSSRKKETPLAALAVGNSVWMNVDGVAYEWLIVNQGLPPDSSLYDSSCDGTWLLMKDVYTSMAWNTTQNIYANSDLQIYLDETFFTLLDSGVQSIVQQVKIPYVNGTGEQNIIASGSDGLSVKVFPLSGYEVGWTTDIYDKVPQDGACLDYFKGMSLTDSGRIAYYNGAASTWSLRSPSINNNRWCLWVTAAGGGSAGIAKNVSNGVRPALILPSDITIDDNGFVVAA